MPGAPPDMRPYAPEAVLAGFPVLICALIGSGNPPQFIAETETSG